MRAAAGFLLFVLVLGVVGDMERQDREAAEEFAREWVAIHDEDGEPVLVRLKEVHHAKTGETVGVGAPDSVRDLPQRP